MAPDSRHYWILSGLLVLTAFLLYGQTARFNFVWDDEYFVVRNPAVHSWTQLARSFTDKTAFAHGTLPGFYRPVRNISFLLDYSIGGLSPAICHIHNVILHAANACLVFWVLCLLAALRRLDREPATAHSQASNGLTRLDLNICWLGALFWTVHPVQTEAVAWVKSRDELLFALFCLAGLGIVLQSLLHGRLATGRIAAVAGLFAAALLSKEMAASFPLIVVLALLLWGRHHERRPWHALIAILVLETAAFIAVRHAVLGQTRQCAPLAPDSWTQFLTMARAFGRYVQLSLVPVNQLADYQGYPLSRSLTDWRVLVSVCVISATVIAAIAVCRKRPVAAFGIGLFWIALIPVSNLVPTMQFLAERFLYLPMLGVSVLLTAAALGWTESLNAQGAEVRTRKLRLGTAVAALLLCALMGASAVRVSVWQNDVTLATRTFLDSPPAGRVWCNYAQALGKQRQFEKALPILQRLASDRSLSGASPALVEQGLGLALIVTGALDEGLSHSLNALRLAPENPDALANVGLYYGIRQNHAKAFEYYDRAVRQNPSDLNLRNNRDTAARLLRDTQSVTSTSKAAATAAR